jgi:hypothetical protein
MQKIFAFPARTEFSVTTRAEISWGPRILSVWTEQVRGEVLRAALDRLVKYFDRNVPGGF